MAGLAFLALLTLEVEARAEAILVVKSGPAAAYDQAIGALREALAGHEITVEDLAGDRGRLAAATQRIRASSAAVLIAVGPLAAEAAQDAGKPIVYLLLPEGRAGSLRGQVTGVRMGVSPARQLGLIKKLLPAARRIAVIYDPARSSAAVTEGREVARRLGLQLMETRVENERAVSYALRAVRADALWLILDDTVVTRTSYPIILRTALAARMPVVTFSQDLVRAGALAAVEADFRDTGRKAAALVQQLLAASQNRPPPIYPEGRLYLNDRVVQQLSISVPADVRRLVGQVFAP